MKLSKAILITLLLVGASSSLAAPSWFNQPIPEKTPAVFDQSTATQEMRDCLKFLAVSQLSGYPDGWVSNEMYQISNVDDYPAAGIMVVTGWVKYNLQGGEDIVLPVGGKCP